MAGSLTELSRSRIRRALSELRDAELLLKNGSFNSSINRSYYAVFHAVRAVEGFHQKGHFVTISKRRRQVIPAALFLTGQDLTPGDPPSLPSMLRVPSSNRKTAEIPAYDNFGKLKNRAGSAILCPKAGDLPRLREKAAEVHAP